EDFWRSQRAEVVLNDALAEELGVRAGDQVTLNLQRPSTVPRESLLGRQEAAEVVDELAVTVAAGLPAAAPGGRLSPNPGPTARRNAFVRLATVQQFLARPRPDQMPLGVKRPINAVLAAGTEDDLQGLLAGQLTLADWGLVLRTPKVRAEQFLRGLDRNR